MLKETKNLASFLYIKIFFVGSVVEWLKRHVCDQHGLGSKCIHHSVVSSGKTLYGTFPCLVVLASSSKFYSCLYKTKKPK